MEPQKLFVVVFLPEDGFSDLTLRSKTHKIKLHGITQKVRVTWPLPLSDCHVMLPLVVQWRLSAHSSNCCLLLDALLVFPMPALLFVCVSHRTLVAFAWAARTRSTPQVPSLEAHGLWVSLASAPSPALGGAQ